MLPFDHGARLNRSVFLAESRARVAPRCCAVKRSNLNRVPNQACAILAGRSAIGVSTRDNESNFQPYGASRCLLLKGEGGGIV
jgi:hypothetical protein